MKDKLYKLMNWPEIEAIIYSEDDNPHRLLGPHKAGNSVVAGYFAALIPGKELPEKETSPKELPSYEYRITWPDGTVKTQGDPYRFGPVISKKDTDRFAAGIH